ncbi:MAG TPA: tudor domain-containing protein [Kofleriaceae bacterium]
MMAPMRLVVMVLLVLAGCDKKPSEPASEEATKTTGAAGSATAPAPGKAESDEGARLEGGAAGGIAAGLDDIAGKAPRHGSAAAAPPAGTTAPPPPPPATVTEPQPQPGSGSAGAAPPPPIAITDTALKVGDRVMAQWTNGSWYPGKIVAITAAGKYDINYDDGDKSRGLPASKVRKKSATTGGGKPASGGGKAASDAPCPGPGITRRCNGVCVNIQENNNHCGGCNNRCPSGKACDGHMFCRDAEGNL